MLPFCLGYFFLHFSSPFTASHSCTCIHSTSISSLLSPTPLLRLSSSPPCFVPFLISYCLSTHPFHLISLPSYSLRLLSFFLSSNRSPYFLHPFTCPSFIFMRLLLPPSFLLPSPINPAFLFPSLPFSAFRNPLSHEMLDRKTKLTLALFLAASSSYPPPLPFPLLRFSIIILFIFPFSSTSSSFDLRTLSTPFTFLIFFLFLNYKFSSFSPLAISSPYSYQSRNASYASSPVSHHFTNFLCVSESRGETELLRWHKASGA